jgi:hypothetical protein
MSIRGIVAGMIVSSLFACAYRSADNLYNMPGIEHRREMYRDLSIDDFGRHLFSGRIYAEPRTAGEKYHIVLVDQRDEKILNSYQIENVPYDRKTDYVKSLKIVYRWTGRGFSSGLKLAGEVMRARVTRLEDAAIKVPAAGVFVVLGTAGGFIVGIADASWRELRKPVGGTAALITEYAVYQYDEKGRLKKMLQCSPTDEPQVLVETSYQYRGDRPLPFRYVVESRPDKKKHVVDVRKVAAK